MKVRWNNVIAFALLFAFTIIAAIHWQSLKQVLSNIQKIGPGHSFEEQTVGIIVVAIVGAGLVAVVRILSRK